MPSENLLAIIPFFLLKEEILNTRRKVWKPILTNTMLTGSMDMTTPILVCSCKNQQKRNSESPGAVYVTSK